MSTSTLPIWESSRVVKIGECLVWNGFKNKKGYGMFTKMFGTQYAHRIAYIQKHGKIPKKLVCHSCDTPSCVNPEHLFSGDDFDNMRDMANKGRSFNQKKEMCSKGKHLLSGDNLYIDPRGYRECKECRRWNVRRFRAKYGC